MFKYYLYLTAVSAIYLLIDNILSRYDIGRMIGEGRNGTVYGGRRLEDGLEVSLFCLTISG